MSQFKYHQDSSNLLNLDGELKMATKARWQRKAENSMNASSKLSVSYNNSMVLAMGNTTLAGSKTPNKSIVEGAAKKKTPNDKKSPGMNSQKKDPVIINSTILLFFSFQGRKTPTPRCSGSNGNGSKTPSGGDRFIPNRSAMNFELGHYLVSSSTH
jgi:hypothetical protein